MPQNQQPADPAETTRSVNDETRAVFCMLIETIVAMAPSGCSAAERLTECRKSMENAPGQADFGPLRESIAESLAAIREESERVAKSGSPKTKAPALTDSATGLPGPAQAQSLIADCIAENKPLFLLLAVFGQLRALNARFGRSVGDEVLSGIAEDFAREFGGDFGTLFRWHGPALVLASDKGATQARVLEQRMKSLAAKRLEKTVNIESRSIHLKIVFSWEMQELNPDNSTEAAVNRLNDYVSSHGGDPPSH